MVKNGRGVLGVLLQSLAILLILVGALGLVIPIVPGWIFIILGLILLGEESRVGGYIYQHLPKRARDLLVKTRRRFTSAGQ